MSFEEGVEHLRKSPVTSICAALLVVLFVASLIDTTALLELTALVLTNTVGQNFYIWNVVSAGFLETNILKLVMNLALAVVVGHQVEATMGMENFAIFVNVVNLACGILTSIGLFSLYVITRFEIYLTIPTYGFGGVLGALFVALKRYTPRASPVAAVPSLKCHQLPMLLFSLSLAAWTLNISSFSHDFPFVICGIYVGWWYQRFVLVNSDGMFFSFSDIELSSSCFTIICIQVLLVILLTTLPSSLSSRRLFGPTSRHLRTSAMEYVFSWVSISIGIHQLPRPARQTR
jgi:membrane associated rhomboid family serine protease